MKVGVEEPSLFDMSEAAPTFQQPDREPFWGAVGTRWSAYKGTHQPCTVYVRMIHERGVEGVPRHLPAARRRVGPNDTILVCSMCAIDLQAKDKAAEAERDRRLAAVAEQERAKRAKRRIA